MSSNSKDLNPPCAFCIYNDDGTIHHPNFDCPVHCPCEECGHTPHMRDEWLHLHQIKELDGTCMEVFASDLVAAAPALD